MQDIAHHFPLTTERLIIRPLATDDVSRMVTFTRANREFLGPWEPTRSDYYFTEDYWQREIGHSLEEMAEERALRLIMLPLENPKGPVVGRINYNNIIRGVFQSTHLGYAIAETYEGKGLMFEALKAANAFMFDHLRLHRLMANYMPHNTRSGTLLKRLGFEKEGLARAYLKIAGKWEDHILTSKINSSDI